MTPSPGAAPAPPFADHHVHGQFSWDAPHGDLEASCRQAQALGLPALVFTEHADFVEGVHQDLTRLDLDAYLAEIERCRSLFGDLELVAGVEMGEPHRYRELARRVAQRPGVQRVLGSVHCVHWEGRLMDASQLRRLEPAAAPDFMRTYLQEVLALVQSSEDFEVLAHLDYPKRYWPEASVPFREADYEEAIRLILRELARRGRALELNTTRGIDPARGLCPAPEVIRWWAEEQGGWLSLGSDAHSAADIAANFALAAEVATGAGFTPPSQPAGYWRR